MLAINLVILAVAASSPVSTTSAAGCAERVGSAIAVKTFEQVLSSLPKAVAPKGEFETTASYEARVAIATNLQGRAMIVHRPVDEQTFPKPVSYDADLHSLNIHNSAFDWGTANWDLAFALADQKGLVSGGHYNAATVLTRTDRPTGSYRAANAFGVSTVVSKVSRTTDSLWARVGRDKNDHLFDGNGDSIIGSIGLSAAQAQVLKPRIHFALVVVPKYPFLITGKMLETVPTIDDSRLVTERFRILIADVQCGLVLDSTNKVLAAFPAK